MRRLADLLKDLDYEASGDLQKEVTGIAYDSRKVRPGNLFVAVEGFAVSGTSFVNEALDRGARAIASAEAVRGQGSGVGGQGVVWIRTRQPRHLLAIVANRFFDDPSSAMKLVGVTGTNGKTTVAWLIRSILEAAGERSGLIGTIRHFDGQEWLKAANTTPESPDIVQMLSKMRSLGINYCVAEVSSHALALERVTGLSFQVGVFTGLTQDHLDFHKTMEEYKQAKLGFFRMLKPQSWAVYNADDPAGAEFKAATQAQTLAYGMEESGVRGQARSGNPKSEVLNPNPDLESGISSLAFPPGSGVGIRNLKLTDKSTTFELVLPDAQVSILSNLAGRHNVYNIMAAGGACWCLGIPAQALAEGVRRLKVVPGRLERIDNKPGLTVYVDYAHSPDALANLIAAARTLLAAKADSEHKVIVVFGCGGNRDKGKRPKMGKIATEMADRVIITSDNPRDEDPDAIIDEIVAGAVRENFEVQANRYDAIKRALFIASKGDIVLIAGKGHEDYQIIGKERRHFDDRETVRAVLGRG
jgi:UDP-N-acetylmuramoyl-L-alanyl-D-glutamate--2,6-diaminopimelate ligase